MQFSLFNGNSETKDTAKILYINFSIANTPKIPPIYFSLTMLKENDLCRSIT